MAHRGHQGSSAAAVERSPQRGLEGQGLIPLEPAASASSGIHQVTWFRNVAWAVYLKLKGFPQTLTPGQGLGEVNRGHL